MKTLVIAAAGALICFSQLTHAQNTCKFKLHTEGKKGLQEYALPSTDGDHLLIKQGETWVELYDSNNLRKRVAKVSLDTFKNTLFKPSEYSEDQLKSTTRKELTNADAEAKYKTFLEQYKCGGKVKENAFEPFGVFAEGSMLNNHNKPMKGAKVLVVRDHQVIDSVMATPEGHFGVSLGQSDCELVFAAPGHVSKKLKVEAASIPEQQMDKGFTLEIDMSLWVPEKGVDYGILETMPVGIAQFDSRSQKMGFDPAYSQQIRHLIGDLIPQ